MTEDELDAAIEARLAAITEAARERYEADRPALARAIALGEELKRACGALGFRAQDELQESFGDQPFDGDNPGGEWSTAEESVRQLVEAAGCQLVSGGQVAGYDEEEFWQIEWTDFRTGAVLAAGRVTPAELSEPWHGLAMPDNAFLADYISDRVFDALNGWTT